MPLGGFRGHGVCRSRLLFEKGYCSIQASLSPAASNYRCANQVTGLLFRSGDNIAHPDLLGQWTGAGPVYDLGEAEQILDLVVMTTKPRRNVMARPALSQVVSITVVTNVRKIHLGPKTADACNQTLMSRSEHRITEVLWDFNAMFDRLRFVNK
jgi:hypothetical protein